MTTISIAATCKGVRVPHSSFLTETRIRRIEEARYEGDEIAGALAVVQPGDRVLEMGAGLGIVGAVTALNARPAAVLSFEANSDLIPHARALYAENGLEDVVELRNEVVISAPDRPETVTFHILNSFLGSSLIDKTNRQTRPVEVPTTSFDDLRDSFRPDVLIMDIEGGELEFLEHADLDGIRAVVIEFHPGVYGVQGVKTCKNALRRVGFVKNQDLSTRFVWTCTRSPAPAQRDAGPPRASGGWSESLRIVTGAMIRPPEDTGLSTPSGVQDSSGIDVAEAALWRNTRRMNLPFERPAGPVTELSGTWLWGGVMWRYFAHFIVESVGRLWALDAPDMEQPKGILFIPRRPSGETELVTFQTGFFHQMGIDLPIRVLSEPTRVERLIVPGQGFGLGDISAGTEPFRRFTRTRFGANVEPEGSEKLYISRSRLGPRRGALLGEERIEQALAAQGYEIFHPERHDIQTQIARYKAARKIVASEGSALHLYAFCGSANQEVAVIPRRRSGATRHILTHISSFTGNDPALLDVLCRVWQPAGTRRARLSVGQPDLPRLHRALLERGFITGAPSDWTPLQDSDIREGLGGDYTPSDLPLAAE